MKSKAERSYFINKKRQAVFLLLTEVIGLAQLRKPFAFYFLSKKVKKTKNKKKVGHGHRSPVSGHRSCSAPPAPFFIYSPCCGPLLRYGLESSVAKHPSAPPLLVEGVREIKK
jgi:hypothetical protein